MGRRILSGVIRAKAGIQLFPQSVARFAVRPATAGRTPECLCLHERTTERCRSVRGFPALGRWWPASGVLTSRCGLGEGLLTSPSRNVVPGLGVATNSRDTGNQVLGLALFPLGYNSVQT